MRKSVVAGILACTLVFVMNSSSASAEEVSKTELDKPISSVAMLLEEVKDTITVVVETNTNVAQPAATPVIIEHTVADNETLSVIAKTHNTTWNRIFDKNLQIADPNIINPGDKLVIPAAEEVLAERVLPLPPAPESVAKPAVQTAPVAKKQPATATTTASKPAATATSAQPRGASSGNLYTAGYCTWYVKNKRPDMPNNLGNAATWVSRAAGQGMATGSTPRAGAVGQRGNHVVYVESVNDDGTVTISEMNHKGLYVQTVRTLPASYFSYIY